MKKEDKSWMPAGPFKITWFNNKAQKVEDKIFEGETAFEDAIKWGKETLENFQPELIQPVLE
jgi:hypothetical protein